MTLTMADVVIFTDEPGWHGRQLVDCCAERGHRAHFVSLADCRIDLGDTGHGLVIPGFAQALPGAAFVRGIAGGSLEEITLRLDFLHLLDRLGCPVFNAARTIERTVDKAMTSVLLRLHDVPTPPTFVSADLEAARAYAARALASGRTLVKKPLFGSQGAGLRRITTLDDLGFLLPGEVAYLQDFVAAREGPYRDCRVMVIDGRAVAAMERTSAHWITNRARGAACSKLALAAAPVALAEAAAIAVGAAYAGVDCLRDQTGQWQVIEVNGIPAWQGLQQATGIDITALLGAAFLRRLAAGSPALGNA